LTQGIGEPRVRDGLIALLPRLRRFAMALCGDADARDRLLRRACVEMIDGSHRELRDAPFDRWAFGEVYRVWLRARSEEQAPTAAASITVSRDPGQDPAGPMSFIRALPAQHRATLLLVLGERFSFEDAAIALQTPEDVLAARIGRCVIALADAASSPSRPAPATTMTQVLDSAGAAA
jgi:RNA polymerase sigma-70 factor (ECF subfamily)